ncbi:unnamed protein product [Candidula unifasciata]|uniref:Glutathione S-transferase n=1 Tax=Candidula unifasciata TaxID=100452 RepID=A0A8S3ZBD7_9EUPU|nr:unnamed protein product [Candidula unifasciata]
MKFHQLRRKKRSQAATEENDDQATSSLQQRLRLQVIHPGKYVPWGGSTASSLENPGQQQSWELKRMNSQSNTFDSQKEPGRDEGAPSQSAEKYNDPMLNVMWREVQAERHVSALIDFKLEQDRKAWATSNYKLTTLEGKRDSELIRLLFVYAGEAFEDERITSDQWEEMKPNTPYYSLPILSKCGKQWGNEGAIVRVLARRFLLMGASNDEHLVVEATYERLRRVKRQNERAINWVLTGEKNKERQEWAQSQLLHVILPAAMKEWEQLITQTRGPFVVASGVTMADLAIMDFLDQCSSCMLIDSLFSEHLAVADLYSVVRQCPKIVNYLDERSND